ncbi:MAG: energy-coupled thiamine transporter ThiT [Firmicutes bacterium]|nr:energy-coupled thiamine transporter ThiT [Bacillota bacterium]
MNRNKTTKYLVLCAVLIALSIGLNQIKLLHLPYGGSITLLSMLAATLCGYFCGPKWGLISGLALGLLNLAIGGYVVHPVQLVLDYILAFTALGLSGFFSKSRNGLYIGYAVAVIGRFISSFLSGWIFFGSYAPEGMNPAAYSFAYQSMTIGAEGVITLIILAIPVVHNTLYRLKKQYDL